ncbi:MAG: U32 family peptidase [Pseudomonadota bacterium]
MSRARILSGLNAPHEVEPLARAGVDELFCGVYTPGDRSHGGRGLSRREGLPFNLDGLSEFAAVLAQARAVGVSLFLALNAFYDANAFPSALRQLDEALALGPDGLIVADLGLLRALRARGYAGQVVIGVGGTAFNPDAVRFYAELGATRVVLPRHLRLDELAAFTPSPVDLELIVLEDRCQFVDGFCGLHHGLPARGGREPFDRRLLARGVFPGLMEGAVAVQRSPMAQRMLGRSANRLRRACSFDYRVSSLAGPEGRAPDAETAEALRRRLRDHVHQGACGLCQIGALMGHGIAHFKIANRGRSTAAKVAGVRLLRRALDLGAIAADHDAIRAAYREHMGHACTPGDCYFPEDQP